MRAVAAYIASRSNQGGNGRGQEMTYGDSMGYGSPRGYDDGMRYDRRTEYGGAESRQYSGDRGGQPNQYTNRSGMDEEWPEMRRRRDKKGRFMEHDGGMDDPGQMTGMPYRPDYPIAEPRGSLYDGGGMGFATRDRQYQTRSNYDHRAVEPQSAQVGGTLWMKPNRSEGAEDGEESMELDRVTAERWARGMHNEDTSKPTGPRWNMEELKPMAQKFGIKPDSEEYVEFWVVTNAMYSDYCTVAKKFNITSPEFYGMMAMAWIKDKDAMPGKTARYYRYIVNK